MIGDIPMRRFENQVHDKKTIEAILDIIPIVHVGSNDGDFPYIVPLNFGYAIKEDKLIVYLHCAREGHKVDLWRKNPKVSLTFSIFSNHPNDKYRGSIHDFRSVMANGLIHEVDRKKNAKENGDAVQAILRHNGRRPNQFSASHYRWMTVFIVECDWKNVSAKTENPVESSSEIPFPSIEEIRNSELPKYDYSHFFNIKHYFPEATTYTEIDKKKFEAGSDESELLFLQEDKKKVYFRFQWESPRDKEIDLDIIALVLNAEGKIARRYDMAFYNQHKDRSGMLEFFEDDVLSVNGEEKVCVDFSKTPEYCGKIAFVATIYNADKKKQDLSMIKRCYLTVENENEILKKVEIDFSGENSQAEQIILVEKEEDKGWLVKNKEKKIMYDWHATTMFAEYGLEKWKE